SRAGLSRASPCEYRDAPSRSFARFAVFRLECIPSGSPQRHRDTEKNRERVTDKYFYLCVSASLWHLRIYQPITLLSTRRRMKTTNSPNATRTNRKLGS